MTWRLLWKLTAMGVAALCVLAGDGGPARAAGPLTFVRSISLLGPAHDVAIAPPYIFVATDTGMTILDASSDPASPVVRGSVAVGGTPTTRTQGIAVDFEGSRAYLASQRAGVSVVDISNLDAPRVVSTKVLPQPAWDVAVKGNIVYAVTNGGQLYVLDGADNLRQLKVIGLLAWSSASQDPAWLKKLNAHVTTGSAKALSVSVAGSKLFTVDWNYGRLYYYNLDSPASPASPRFSGTHYAPFILAAVADPAKDVVYMLGAYGRFSGIYTVPISWLELAPTHSTRYNTCPDCRFLKSTGNIDQGGIGLSPGGDHLFYGGGRAFEFHVVDVSDPATLHDVASANTGNHALPMPETMGFASSGDHIYVGAGIQGLQIYQLGGASD